VDFQLIICWQYSPSSTEAAGSNYVRDCYTSRGYYRQRFEKWAKKMCCGKYHNEDVVSGNEHIDSRRNFKNLNLNLKI
jgi:hypothetical protein